MEEPHGVHAHHHQFRVAEPDHVHDAEHEVQPEHGEREHAAEQRRHEGRELGAGHEHLAEFHRWHLHAEAAEVGGEHQRRGALQHEEHAAGGEHLVDRRRGQQGPDHEEVQQEAEHGDDGQAGGEGEGERPARLGVEEPHGVHAHHDQLRVAEPDHVDDADHQVQPEHRQGEHTAEQHAVQQRFQQERIHARQCPPR